MSKKYLVLTRIEGQIKMLALTSNLSRQRQLYSLCRRMLKTLFKGQNIGEFQVEPWPRM